MHTKNNLLIVVRTSVTFLLFNIFRIIRQADYSINMYLIREIKKRSFPLHGIAQLKFFFFLNKVYSKTISL